MAAGAAPRFLPSPSTLTSDSDVFHHQTSHSFFGIIFPIKPVNVLDFDASDSVFVLVFLGLGVLTRILCIQYPRLAVFKEPFYSSILNRHFEHRFVLSPSPNVGHLILSAVASFAEFGDCRSFSTGERYPTMFYAVLRLISAFFGSICVPLSYVCFRVLSISHLGSVTGAVLICGDLLMIAESRYYGADSLSHLFVALALFSIVLFERFPSLRLLLIEGISLGLCSDFGHFGILALAFVRQFQFRPQPALRRKRAAQGCVRTAILIIVIFFVKLLVYAVHLTWFAFADSDTIAAAPGPVQKLLLDQPPTELTLDNRDGDIVLGSISFMLYNVTERWQQLREPEVTELWRESNIVVARFRSPLVIVPIALSVAIGTVRLIAVGDFESSLALFIEGFFLSYFSGRAARFVFAVFHAVAWIDRSPCERVRGFLFYFTQHLAITAYFLGNCFVYGKKVDDLAFYRWNFKLN
jgi:hypothetical protein